MRRCLVAIRSLCCKLNYRIYDESLIGGDACERLGGACDVCGACEVCGAAVAVSARHLGNVAPIDLTSAGRRPKWNSSLVEIHCF